MRRFLDRLYAASGALAALCLASICVLMLAQALGREFGLLIRGADDITSWLCAAAAFFALGHTFRHGELVRVGLFIDMLGRGARRVAEIVALARHRAVRRLHGLGGDASSSTRAGSSRRSRRA